MNIVIVMPDGAAARSGNQHTAQRWAHMLRELGHRVTIASAWRDAPTDLLIALHARKSHASASAFHQQYPRKPLVVVLTGTDLYRDIRVDTSAACSLEIASRLVVLQDHGRLELAPRHRRKTRVIYQSANVKLDHVPVRKRFRVAVIGHLREEKDPFRAVQALSLLPQLEDVEIIQIGKALNSDMRREALAWMRKEPRYRWLDSQPHHRTLRWLASSDLLVVSSAMEGGANVICEASRIGVPIIASRIAGNIGMLGTGYPGFFPLYDGATLARLLARAASDGLFYKKLKQAVLARRPLFAPSSERRGLRLLLQELC
jgi:putative glycosyltransferase (TIGR04348 family)